MIRSKKEIDSFIGKIFNRWKILNIKSNNNTKYKRLIAECLCECGNVKTITLSSLINNMSKSCGCYRKEIVSKLHTTHGHAKQGFNRSKTYKAWSQMLTRVRNKNIERSAYYSKKGISVDKSWLIFENFLKDMGEIPKDKTSLDRLNNSKGYSKNNCRWANAKEQANNTTRSVKLTYKGNTLTIAQWSDLLGLNRYTLYYRYRKNKNPNYVLKKGNHKNL